MTGYGSVISKCQVMQLLKTNRGHLKPGSVAQVGTMAQKLLQRKWWSSRPHGSCARDGAAPSLESFTQRALSSGVPSHRQKPNPPGIQPSAVRLCPEPLEVLSHKQPHAAWQSPLGTFSLAKETKGKKKNQKSQMKKKNPTKNQQKPQNQTQHNKILNFR